MSKIQVRLDIREAVAKDGTIYNVDFYLIGNPRKALRKQIALAAVWHKPDGDKWDTGFEEIKTMDEYDRMAFLQRYVDQNEELLMTRIAEVEAKA